MEMRALNSYWEAQESPKVSKNPILPPLLPVKKKPTTKIWYATLQKQLEE
jgi:hypothetical protein